MKMEAETMDGRTMAPPVPFMTLLSSSAEREEIARQYFEALQAQRLKYQTVEVQGDRYREIYVELPRQSFSRRQKRKKMQRIVLNRGVHPLPMPGRRDPVDPHKSAPAGQTDLESTTDDCSLSEFGVHLEKSDTEVDSKDNRPTLPMLATDTQPTPPKLSDRNHGNSRSDTSQKQRTETRFPPLVQAAKPPQEDPWVRLHDAHQRDAEEISPAKFRHSLSDGTKTYSPRSDEPITNVHMETVNAIPITARNTNGAEQVKLAILNRQLRRKADLQTVGSTKLIGQKLSNMCINGNEIPDDDQRLLKELNGSEDKDLVAIMSVGECNGHETLPVINKTVKKHKSKGLSVHANTFQAVQRRTKPTVSNYKPPLPFSKATPEEPLPPIKSKNAPATSTAGFRGRRRPGESPNSKKRLWKKRNAKSEGSIRTMADNDDLSSTGSRQTNHFSTNSGSLNGTSLPPSFCKKKYWLPETLAAVDPNNNLNGAMEEDGFHPGLNTPINLTYAEYMDEHVRDSPLPSRPNSTRESYNGSPPIKIHITFMPKAEEESIAEHDGRLTREEIRSPSPMKIVKPDTPQQDSAPRQVKPVQYSYKPNPSQFKIRVQERISVPLLTDFPQPVKLLRPLPSENDYPRKDHRAKARAKGTEVPPTGGPKNQPLPILGYSMASQEQKQKPVLHNKTLQGNHPYDNKTKVISNRENFEAKPLVEGVGILRSLDSEGNLTEKLLHRDYLPPNSEQQSILHQYAAYRQSHDQQNGGLPKTNNLKGKDSVSLSKMTGSVVGLNGNHQENSNGGHILPAGGDTVASSHPSQGGNHLVKEDGAQVWLHKSSLWSQSGASMNQDGGERPNMGKRQKPIIVPTG